MQDSIRATTGRSVAGRAEAALAALVALAWGPEGCAIAPPQKTSSATERLNTNGLVVAYAFNEGSGTTVSDASGNGNTATLLNGASFAPGHTGSAGSFDGVSGYAKAADVTALNGLTAVTASAWVKGSVGGSSPDGVIVAKDTVFAVIVSGHKAQFAIKSGSTWFGFPSSTTSVDDGNFHFLTGVYDGTIARIYVDGVQEGSNNIGAYTMNSASSALQMASCTGGPDCDRSGEMWHGLIDDVRVYNRALSNSEIQTDRDTPVLPPSADNTPPTVPANVTGTAPSSTRIDLTWTGSTDDVAVAGYNVFRGNTQVGTSSATSFSDTGLMPSTTYTYTVVAFDAARNDSAPSSPVSVRTQADAPPSTPTNVVGTAVSSTQINLTWTASTDDVAVTGYRVSRNGSVVGTPTATSFSDTGLNPSTTYTYAVTAIDTASLLSASSASISMKTLASNSAMPSCNCTAPATCGGGGTPNACGYSTNFSANPIEMPISQGGIWWNGQQTGNLWSDVFAGLGRAYGAPTNTTNGTGRYADPTAILKGAWNPNQRATGKVFCSKNVADHINYPEVELRLRFTISAKLAKGYEIMWRCSDSTASSLASSYLAVAAWLGGSGQFSVLTITLPNSSTATTVAGGGVEDGDTVAAAMYGTTISLYKNGRLQGTVNDSRFTSGNPGIGMNYVAADNGGPTSGYNVDFGFTSFSATELLAAP